MKRILLVDDIEQNRYLLEATLHGYGYETVSARDGAEALATARLQPPDLVISDILMPVMDGFALCRAWRADERLRGIPFIFYTATYTDPKDEQLALDLGADRFVLKPQEPQVLIEIVRAVLARGAKPAVPGATKALPDELVTLREYNEVLVRKLAKKLDELEAAHQQLLEDTRQRKEAEAALRRSEAKYRTLIERMDEGLVQVDDDDIIRFVNPQLCRMLGYSETELLGQHAATLLNREEDRAAMAERNRQRSQGISEGYEIRLRKKSGEFLHAWNSATPVATRDGRASGSMAIITDISGRKQAEAIVACQTQVLEKIATGTPLAETLDLMLRHMEAFAPGMLCSVLLLDADGQRLRHGAAPSLPETFTRAIDGVSIGADVGSCGTAAFRREAVIVEDIATDPLWKDFRELALAHGLRASWSTPIFDEQQRVLGTFAIYYRHPVLPTALHRRCIDLATSLAAIAISRTRAEAALHMMRFSVDRAGDTVFWVSPEGRILYANDSAGARRGYSREELLAMTIFDLDPDFQPGIWPSHWAELKRCGTLTFETRHRGKDGREFPVEVNANFVQAGGSELNFAFVRDITGRKQAERKVEDSRAQLRALLGRLQRAREEERTRVSREIHDELGQLLTCLKMDMSWLERKLADPGLPAALHPLLDRAVAASELADTTIAVVQKIAAELHPAALDRLGLGAALGQAGRRFQENTGLPCRVAVAEPGPALPAEIATELFYICQEALTNVTRHAHATEVRIRLEANDDALVLEICDDGVGMAEADFNAARSLGLLGMKERAAQCAGTIVWERGEPRGTRVMVRIPSCGASGKKGGQP